MPNRLATTDSSSCHSSQDEGDRGAQHPDQKTLKDFEAEYTDKIKSVISDIRNYPQLDSFTDEQLLLIGLDCLALRSANDSESIKFSNLGFRNKTDCDAWVTMHHPGTDFGFIMDFHLVMAHVHHAISGTSLMDNLHKVHKMHYHESDLNDLQRKPAPYNAALKVVMGQKSLLRRVKVK